ncbi:spore coat protein [Rossellomorea sp. H39__3]
MDQSKIQNPKTQVPDTPQMNDRDFMTDILALEKHMTASYGTALNEASHDGLYQDILSVFTETQNAQRDLYNEMFRKGWYSLEAADNQTLQQSLKQHQQTAVQFPYKENGPIQ